MDFPSSEDVLDAMEVDLDSSSESPQSDEPTSMETGIPTTLDKDDFTVPASILKAEQTAKQKVYQTINSVENSNKIGRNHMDFVGMISPEGKISLGATVNGLRSHMLKKNPVMLKNNKNIGVMKYDFGILETMNADATVGTWKECFPKKKHMILLDRKWNVNSEVFHRCNPRRFGHVTKVSTTADCYLPDQQKIVVDVPVNDDTYVTSFNSSYWRQQPMIFLQNKRGRVLDALYECILRDDSGHQMKLEVKALGSAARLRKKTDNRMFPTVITSGDRVTFVTTVELDPVWLGEVGTVDKEIEWLVEKVVLQKVSVHWDRNSKPTKTNRFCPSVGFGMPIGGSSASAVLDLLKDKVSMSSLPDSAPNKDASSSNANHKESITKAMEALEGQLETVKGYLSDTYGQLHSLTMPTETKTGEETPSFELIGQLSKVQEQLQESLTMSLEQGPSFVVSGPVFFSHSSSDSFLDSPLIKRRRPDGPVDTSEWINVSQLQPHSLLPPKMDVVTKTKLKLSGQYHLLSPEAYYNSLLPMFQKHMDQKLEPIPEKQASEDALLDTYGEVINRHHKITVHWFDGEIEEGIYSAELEQSFKKNVHPTSINVYRNMILRRKRVQKPTKRGDRERLDKEGANEFGLVTKVSEEKMLTVVWFKKESEDSTGYIRIGEEVISQYEHIRHSLYRIPLNAVVYFPGDRDADYIYNCIGRVISLNDDGTETVEYFDGSTAKFWPNEAVPLDSEYGYDGFAELGGYIGYDEDPVDAWESEEEEPMEDPLTEFSSYSSLGSFSLGSTPSDFHSYMSSFTPTSTITIGAPPAGTAIAVSAPSSVSSSTVGTVTGDPVSSPSSTDKAYCRAVSLRNGTAMEIRFVESMKLNQVGLETPEGMTILAAIFANLDPSERKMAWDQTSLAQHLESVDSALQCDKIGEARDMIRLMFNKSRTEKEEKELSTLNETWPDLRQNIEELFEYKKGIKSDIVHLVHALFTDLEKQFLYRREHRTGEELDSRIFVIYPVQNTKEAKELLDEKISPDLSRLDRISRQKIILSYLCPSEHCSFLEMTEEQAAYICNFSGFFIPEGCRNAVAAYKEKFKPEKDTIFVGSMKSIKMHICLKIAYEKILQDDYTQDERIELLTTTEDFSWVCSTIAKAESGDNAYHLPPYYSKRFTSGVDEPEKDKFNRLDLQLSQIAETLNFDVDHPLPRTFDASKDPDNLHLYGEMYPDIPVPRALVLQVSSSLNNCKPTESFLVFQILSQIVDSSTWPECSIKISKDSGNNGTFSSNFCAAWMLLRQSGDFLKSRYFNIAEAKNLALILNRECTTKRGPNFEKYGYETVRLLRNILMKMSSLNCVKLWRRANLFEKHFGISRVLEAVKDIILNRGTKSVIPFKDLPEMTQKCTDVELKNELTTIQLNYVSSLQIPTVIQGTFKTVDSVSSHSFSSMEKREMRRDFVATIKKEHKLLRDNIPEGVHVVTFADRLDLFRAIIVGPLDTPYEGVPFLFDIYLDPQYPQVPPKVKYASLTGQAINPNLYTEGTVCLSLLGTWKGDVQTMRWIPGTSSILQVVFSIQVEILGVADPYYNEPGFETRRNSEEGKAASKHYNSQVCVGANEYFAEIMKEPPVDFIEFLQEHKKIVPSFIKRWTDILNDPEKAPFNVDINESVRHVIRRCHQRLQTAIEHFPHGENSSVNVGKDDHLISLAKIFSVDPTTILTLFSSGNPAAIDDSDLASFVLLRQTSI